MAGASLSATDEASGSVVHALSATATNASDKAATPRAWAPAAKALYCGLVLKLINANPCRFLPLGVGL